MFMNDDILRNMRKEAIVACFEIHSRRSIEAPEKPTKVRSQGRQTVLTVVIIYLKKDALSPWDAPREAAWTGIERGTSNFRCMMTMLSCLEKSYSPCRKKKKKKSTEYLLDASPEAGLEVGLCAEKSKCMCITIQCKAIT